MLKTIFPAPVLKKLNASVFGSLVAELTSCTATNGERKSRSLREKWTYEEESQVEVRQRGPSEKQLDSVVDEKELEEDLPEEVLP